MPAKKLVPREKIVQAATRIVRRRGIESLNARILAAELKCSTRPIYLSFKGMEEVRGEVLREATEIYRSYTEKGMRESEYPKYKAYGMSYIRFAKEEKLLFKFLFMRDRSRESREETSEDTEKAISMLMENLGLDYSSAYLFQTEIWIYVHGIATMLATGYLDLPEEIISGLVTDAYEGLKLRYTQREGRQ